MITLKVLYAPGTNCHAETVTALAAALAEEKKIPFTDAQTYVHLVNLQDLIDGHACIDDCNLLALPGGFSFGDHLGGGKILAVKMKQFVDAQIGALIAKKIPVIGICNGFQLMTRIGLLPSHWKLEANDCQHFRHGIARLKVKHHPDNIWIDGNDDFLLHYAHGEGRLVATNEDYSGAFLHFAHEENPNGSPHNVTAVVSEDGLRIGLMPHPERNIFDHHQGGSDGLRMFRAGIRHVLRH